MITTIIGIKFFNLTESNSYAFPLVYGVFTCFFWFMTDKYVFCHYKKIKNYVFVSWILILGIPIFNNLCWLFM